MKNLFVVPAKRMVWVLALGVFAFTACNNDDAALEESVLDAALLEEYATAQATFMLQVQANVGQQSATEREAATARVVALRDNPATTATEAGAAMGFAPGVYEHHLQTQGELVQQLVAELSDAGYSDAQISSTLTEAADLAVPAKLNALARGNCVTIYNICTQGAEADFAISSASCSSAWILGPGGWALCQGSANLGYYADISDCGHSYDDCAATNEGGN